MRGVFNVRGKTRRRDAERGRGLHSAGIDGNSALIHAGEREMIEKGDVGAIAAVFARVGGGRVVVSGMVRTAITLGGGFDINVSVATNAKDAVLGMRRVKGGRNGDRKHKKRRPTYRAR